MIINIPTLIKEYDEKNDRVVVKENTIKCNIDMSVYAENRWEAHFPKQAKNVRLFDYIGMLLENKDDMFKNVYVASMLKAIYCFIDSDDLPTYKKFAQLFDLTDEKYVTKLINKLKHIFELVLNTSAVDQKN